MWLIVYSRLLKFLHNWTIVYTESTLGKLLDLSKRSCFCLLWIHKCPFFYILFLFTIYVNYWTEGVKKPVNAHLFTRVIQIPYFLKQTCPFCGQNVPTPEKVEKGPPFSFFYSKCTYWCKADRGEAGHGAWGGDFYCSWQGHPMTQCF